MKTYKIITALSLVLGLLAGNMYAQESDKAETKVKLIAEKNGKTEVFEKTLPGMKNNFNKEDVEALFGVKKADYDKFIVTVACNRTVTNTKDGDDMKNIEVTVDGNDIKVNGVNVSVNADGDNTEMVVMSNKDGKTEKQVFNHKGKMTDAEIDNLLKEHGISTAAAAIDGETTAVGDGNSAQVKVIHLGDDKSTDGKAISKKVIIKTSGDGKLSDEDIKNLKKQGIDVNVNEEVGDGKVIRKTMIVKINLQDIAKGDIEEANKNGARLSVNAPELKVDRLAFFPNPNNGKFNLGFTLPDKGNTVVSVFDITGREVYHEELANFTGNYSKEIDLTRENKGTYLIQVVQNGKAGTRKLLVE